MLIGDNDSYVRKDISAEHWTEPPNEDCIWWKSTAKHITDNAPQHLTEETLQSLFDRLITQNNEADTLYILTLLLLRRKLLRYEKDIIDERGNKLLEVYSLQTNMTYQILVAMPDRERLEAIQQQLAGVPSA